MTSMSRSQAHGYSFGWMVERGRSRRGCDACCKRMGRTETSYGSVPLQSIMPTSDPLREHTKGLKRFSAVDPACYNFSFLGRFHQDKLLDETTDEAVTGIWALTVPYWIYNADEDDLLPSEKLTQKILDKFFLILICF